MGGIGSNVVYITTTLVAGNQPAIAPTDQASAITVAAPKTRPNEPRARGYVILDVPKPGGAVGALGDAIAEGLRRSRDEYARARPEAGTLTQQDFSVGGGPAISEAGELDGAVVAAHEARIAVLRERIDSLKAGSGPAATQFPDLSIRLKRAEAARKLAVARMALGEPPRDCDPRSLVSPCGDVPKAAAALESLSPRPLAVRQRPPIAARPQLVVSRGAKARRSITADRIAGPSRIGMSDHPPLPAAAHAPGTNMRLAPLRGVGHARIATSASPAVRAAIEPGAANRLGRARHLLTVARSSLEGAGGERRYAPIRLAGLWQWVGSDTWSLADYARRNA